MDTPAYLGNARKLVSEYAHIRLFPDEGNALDDLIRIFETLAANSEKEQYSAVARLSHVTAQLCKLWSDKRMRLSVDLLVGLPMPKLFLDDFLSIERTGKETDMASTISQLEEATGSLCTKQISVLLAEDDTLFKQMYTDALKGKPVALDYAENGEEAIARLSAKPYDCILLDIIMPKKNGFEVLQYCAENNILSKTAVIALTTLGDAANKERILAMGASEFVHKDTFDFAGLHRKITDVITKHTNTSVL